MPIALVALQDGLGIDLVRFFFRLVVRDAFFTFLSSSWGRFGPLLGFFAPLRPSWHHLGALLGSFSLLLAPFSVQVGPETVFEPSYLRKSDCSLNITFSNALGFFCLHMAPQNDPRSLQDGSKTVSDRCFFLFDYRFDFCSFWDRFWCRFGLANGPLKVVERWAELGKSALVALQDGLGIDLACRLGLLF